jgi:chromosome segregation protein
VDGKLRDLVRVFFADTYVVDSIEDVALKGHQEGFRFVTRSGILVDDRGGLSGGSAADKDESLLVGRKERLKNFMAAAEESARKITGLERDRASKASSVQGLEGKVKELEETLHQEEIDLANAASKRDAVKSGLAKFREEVSLLDLELDEIGQTITDIRSKEEAYKAELADSAARNNELAGLISHLTDGIARDKDEREKIALEMAALRTELTSLEREFPNAENGLNKEKALLAEFEASIESKKDLLKESARKVEDLSGEIVSLEAENVTFEIDLSLFNEENAGLEKERSDSSDKLGIAELQVKESEKVLEELRGELKTTEMKIMDLGYKKTSLKERIISAYKVDLDSAHIEVDDDADWETIRANIQEWKTKLDEMGPVNLVAIDEHKELEERYAFLTHQQLDLVNAKESLHKAILKINKTTKELFLEVFQKIQIEFKNFFRMLFGGGQAELVLIDEQDVLESGIEIVARPPGKKLQNIMLLSGGEKALTAIALLFAIFKVKPSPFCLLDEIDAPLDESNIMRFSNVLKDFLKMSQFILITHNKKTIELADVMYGITMQERGISKIVSVKFLAGDKEADKEKDGKKEEVLA